MVVALALALQCCLHAHDRATREQWERSYAASGPARRGSGTPAGAAIGGGGSSQVRAQTTDYDEEAPQTHRKLLGGGENADVDVGFGTAAGQPDLVVKGGHTTLAKADGDATHGLQAAAAVSSPPLSSALATPVQKIGMDEHFDTKEKYEKE